MLSGRMRWALVGGLGLLSLSIPLAVRLGGSWPWKGSENTAKGGDRLLEALLESDQPVSSATVQGSTKQTNQDSSDRDQSRRPKSARVLFTPQASATPQLRVALFRQLPLRRLETRGDSRCLDHQGNPYTAINIKGWSGSRLICQSLGSGAIVLNGLPYQGIIELVRSGDDWLPVNQLDLETYVASVVGAEMPSHWNREALKAQAVAARSYALVHLVRPAATHYHLGDTTRWQVYGGDTSTAPTTLAAAEATKGEVLSFRGGLVESLYAATESITAEAHGHLGASMSQTGAHALAQQGHSYTQILDRYYKGAELARITPNGP